MTTTNLEEPLQFLDIIASKGYWNDNTVQGRRTACNKFFEILDPDQKNVEYVRDNLDVIKGCYMNLNKDAAGATVDEYGRRVKLVLDEFIEWKADRTAWEKKNAAKQNSRPAGDSEKKPKVKAEKSRAEPATTSNSGGSNSTNDPTMRTVEFPLRSGDAKIVIPRDFTVADVRRIAWALLPYASDFDPEVSPRDTFPMLEREPAIHTQ